MAQQSSYSNITGSGVVKSGKCVLASMYVNSTNSGTVKLWDSLAASGTAVGGTITPAIGFHNLGNIELGTGLYVQVGGTSIDVTFHIKSSD